MINKENSGIYIVINLNTGRVLVGQTSNFKARKWNYQSKLRRNCYPNQHLQNSWNKHGENNFLFLLIEDINDFALLTTREQYWLDFYRNLPEGVYNQIGPADCPLRGYIPSKETRQRISSNNARYWKGKSLSIETRLKLSIASKGKKPSEETKQRISSKLKGHITSKETKRKISSSLMGYKFSEERKKKISTALKGKKMLDSTREKLIAANTGRIVSLETKNKISLGNKGHHRGAKYYKIIWPDSHEETILNLAEFARKNNLDSSSLVKVAKGKLTHSKGFKVHEVH